MEPTKLDEKLSCILFILCAVWAVVVTVSLSQTVQMAEDLVDISNKIVEMTEETESMMRELETELYEIEAELDDLEKEVEILNNEVDTIIAMLEIRQLENTYTKEIEYLSKTVWGEARGCSSTEQAAVVWCILNRVDSDRFSDDISTVITQKGQFYGYNPDYPVTDDIRALVVDVLKRWELERLGEVDVGRVLPREYLYFYGDGARNHFTVGWKDSETWDWSLESPYI